MFPMNMKTKPQKNKGSGDKPSDTVQVMIKKILNSLRRKDEQVKSFKKMLYILTYPSATIEMLF